ncbi:MAG: hypothetical protein IT383_27180 [Deltaproteobacteria bacterium]|nr:hypothetical protein [Deltaproteobacteria bacterium]
MVALGLAAAPAAPGDPVPHAPAASASRWSWRHPDLEALYVDGRFAEGLIEARRRIAVTPDDAHLYGHAARFLYELGELKGKAAPRAERRAIYREMLRLLEEGLRREPGHPLLLFGLGLAKARLGTTDGVLASLWMARSIEDSWRAAIASGFAYRSANGENQLPCDAMVALGIMQRMIPDWWILGVIAGTRGDLDASLALLDHADGCAPGRIRTMKERAATLLCMGTRRGDDARLAEGRALAARVAAMAPATGTERIDVRDARALASEPALACAYSRDGQQDLDERRLAGR